MQSGRRKLQTIEKDAFHSCGWCSKWPQTWWLKTEIYSLAVLKSRSPKITITRLKSRPWALQRLLGHSFRAFPSCLFQLLVVLVFSGLWLPHSHLQGQFSQLSRSVVSDSLLPHGLQHVRLPCPSPAPGAYSNSCPLSPWRDRRTSAPDVFGNSSMSDPGHTKWLSDISRTNPMEWNPRGKCSCWWSIYVCLSLETQMRVLWWLVFLLSV